MESRCMCSLATLSGRGKNMNLTFLRILISGINLNSPTHAQDSVAWCVVTCVCFVIWLGWLSWKQLRNIFKAILPNQMTSSGLGKLPWQQLIIINLVIIYPIKWRHLDWGTCLDNSILIRWQVPPNQITSSDKTHATTRVYFSYLQHQGICILDAYNNTCVVQSLTALRLYLYTINRLCLLQSHHLCINTHWCDKC